jgi:ribonuclease HII
VLLDGSYDWLTRPPPTLFDDPGDDVPGFVVTTRIKADLSCAGVAAASVLAKTERDRLMVGMADDHPEYGWAVNKGYATPDHRVALRDHGPCPQHRRTWHLLGADDGADDLDGPGGSEHVIALEREGPDLTRLDDVPMDDLTLEEVG